MKRNDPASLVRYIAAMTIFGSIGIVRRFIPMPSAALACFRGFTGSLFLLLLTGLRPAGRTAFLQTLRHSSRRTTFLLALSGALIGLNWIFLFEAYNYTRISTATLCYYMQPTIVILLSPLLFREKLTIRRSVCAAVSLIGMVLISGILSSGQRGGLEMGDVKGILFGLAAALLYAMVVILNKKLPGIESNTKTILQLGAAALALLPYLLITGQGFRFEGISGAVWVPVLMLLTAGIVHTGIAYRLYFGSMDGLRAQTLAVLGYLDPVIALLLSAWIFGERMPLAEGFGAVLILGAALTGELHND